MPFIWLIAAAEKKRDNNKMLMMILATFTAPEIIETNPASFLWLLPLVAAIAVVWKALKLKEISAAKFIKEVAILFISGIVLIVIVAIGLYVVTWITTQ